MDCSNDAWLAAIYRIEREMATFSAEDRLDERRRRTQPLWDQWYKWLLLERQRVPDGSATAKALEYSINSWQALTRHLLDGQVNVDNNSLENLLRPWAMGRKAWLFVGSELAGSRRTEHLLGGHQRLAQLDSLERYKPGKNDYSLDAAVVDDKSASVAAHSASHLSVSTSIVSSCADLHQRLACHGTFARIAQ